VINSFASKYGLESEKGTILGIFRSLQALARAIGPLLASFGNTLVYLFIVIYDFSIYLAYWSIGERTTYIFGGILLLCPLLILVAVQKRFERMRVMPTITVSEVKDD
jgi:MFS family permease